MPVDQGLMQVVEAAETGLPPKQSFVLALSDDPKGGGRLEPLAGFVTNPAGAAIVNTIGPIRHVTQSTGTTPKALSRHRCRHTGAAGRAGASANAGMRRRAASLPC